MKSPELQQLTASEPLTLEQEFLMQQSWRQDDDSEPHLFPSRTMVQQLPQSTLLLYIYSLTPPDVCKICFRVHLHRLG